ncbi:MAG: AAA family ATPase [Rivularia sp. (in: cyanobacteria)]|jgi:AAA+ ATPase superfamily predicted ATPase
MTQPFSKAKLWNDLAECFRILYWAYFKPYTFANWLRDIHPELKAIDNPFTMKAEFNSNPRLHRYAEQVWLITAIVPTLLILLAGLIYTFSQEVKLSILPENSLFVVGWWIGLWLARGKNKKLEKLFEWSFWICFLVAAIWMLVGVNFPSQLQPFGYLALGIWLGVAWGVSLGIGWGVAWFITWIIWMIFIGFLLVENTFSQNALVVAGTFLWRIAWVLASGVASGVALGVTAGVALGIASGLDNNSHWVIAVAIFFLLIPIFLYLIEVLWITVIYIFSQLRKAAPLLPYLPPCYNERIILPLPFIVQIIVKAHQEAPLMTREMIKYLITSTNQQKVANKAIIQIALDSLNKCKTLRDIAEIINQLNWIPPESSKDIDWVIKRLLDISQYVSQSYEETSPYLQYKFLEKPIAALESLINSISSIQNPQIATNVGSIAQNWKTILVTAQQVLRERAVDSEEVRQVYIAGNALDPQTAKQRFKGRIDLFREIQTSALEVDPPALLLYGGRRTGKTSALKYLPYKVGADLIPLLIDIQGLASAITLIGFAQGLAGQITEAARRLPRPLNLPLPNQEKLEKDPFIALQNWLAEIELTFPHKRFLLCLDEYERLSEIIETTGSKAPLNFFRNILQHRPRWILLFSGSHHLEELPDYWSDYLINTHSFPITYLSQAEARELILHPIDDFADDIYEDAAVENIIHLTRCQPFFVQLTCYEIVEIINRDIRENQRNIDESKVSPADLERVIPIVLRRADPYFRELRRSFSAEELNLLYRLVGGEQPQLEDKLDKTIVRSLIRKEILQREVVDVNDSEKTHISFQVPLVQKYIENFIEEEM